MPTTRPDGTPYAVARSEDDWRAALGPEEYRVLREAGTEAPFRGEYTDTKTRGTYSCRACGNELFSSDTKFESHCGWPSFWSPLAGDNVELLADDSMGMRRVEVRCARCGSHLGHVFDDGPPPTYQRYCINGVALNFEPETPDKR